MIDSLPLMDAEASCAAYRRVLDDIVADEVAGAALAQTEAHLARCAVCRFALAQARTYRRMMRRVGQGMRAPNSLRDRVLGLLSIP
jgi:predicted anti-sigma-YlaC factor YlaD